MAAIKETMKRGWIPDEMGHTVIIGHGDCPDRAADLMYEVMHAFLKAEINIADIGPVTEGHPDKLCDRISDRILEELIKAVIPNRLWDEQTKVYINPTGRFVLGGPAADIGLTGRKIIADTYGGVARHGGGAFSGKDPTKVDRSAAYMARYVAKHIVAAGLADKCEIQLGYAIGVARPVSVMVDTFGTGKVPDEVLEGWVKSCVDLCPGSIIDRLKLRRPIYLNTAAYGHFGRGEFPWEEIDPSLIASLRWSLDSDY